MQRERRDLFRCSKGFFGKDAEATSHDLFILQWKKHGTLCTAVRQSKGVRVDGIQVFGM